MKEDNLNITKEMDSPRKQCHMHYINKIYTCTLARHLQDLESKIKEIKQANTGITSALK